MEKGFTLIEVMLVVGLTLAVGFLATSFSGRFMAQSAVSDASGQFRSALSKAHAYSISGKLDSSWGVHYANSTIILFAGDSFGGRDIAHDEITQINTHINVSGFEEVTFVRPDGRPVQPVSDLKLSWDNLQEESLSINSEGVIQ
jgi:prepilin-type N-terminal cleavage/methylation domain-containing protein